MKKYPSKNWPIAFFSIFFVLLFLSDGLSQPVNNKEHIQDVVMPAPEAAALGKYGDVPVSYSTGVPQIGVPIYSLQEGPLTLPVSINYHASGIKVAEVASWVGLGWSLSAGGMVSRSIIGLPDDDPEGYYYHGIHLDASANTLGMIGDRNWDGEPDIFSFSFGNYSGKLIFDENNDPVLIPKQDLMIDSIRTGMALGRDSQIIGITIRDPEGVKYHFGNAPNETSNEGLEYTDYKDTGGSGIPGDSDVTTWHLVKIESHDNKHSITLSYEAFQYSYETLGSCEETRIACIGGSGGPGAFDGCRGALDPILNRYLNRQYISGKRLKTITTSTDSMTFNAITPRDDLAAWQSGSTGAKRLDNMELESDTFCMKWELGYSYFEDKDQTSMDEFKRLKLNSIQKKSCNGDEENPFQFSYFAPINPSDSSQNLINRLTRQIDHWGFYNGAIGNESIPPDGMNIPPTTVGGAFTAGNSDRETNPNTVKHGVISEIQYPTGGVTFYEFEPNSVMDYTSQINSLIDLKTCAQVGDPYCCDHPSNSTTRIFTNQEIQDGKYRLTLEGLCDSICPTGGGGPLHIALDVYEVGCTVPCSVISHVSFNLNPCSSPFDFIENPLTTLNLIASVNYEFIITVDSLRRAKGSLEITETFNVPIERYVGGLRVKKIQSSVDSIPSSDDIIKTYEYKSKIHPTYSSGILYENPRYGSYFPMGVIFTSGDTTEFHMAKFYDQAIVPLGGYHGNHIMYENVTEYHNGNGRKEMTFIPLTQSPDTFLFPVPPTLFNVLDGKLKEEKILSESGAELSKNLTVEKPPSYSGVPGLCIKVGSFPLNCGPNTEPQYIPLYYTPRTDWYQVASTTTELDEVSTTTNYLYDYYDRISFPISEEFTNSNGDIVKKTYEYLHTLPWKTTHQEMIARNIITPWRTSLKINNDLVANNSTDFRMFNNITGLYQSTVAGGSPRPYKYLEYEKTWDANGNSSGQNRLIGQVFQYDANGFPHKYRKGGWSDFEYFDWESNGLIKQRKFKDFEWNYTYHLGTRLLASIEDIDGQKSEFEYDGLMRLKTSKARQDQNTGIFNVITEYDYNYKDLTPNSTVYNNYNWVKTKINFTPTTGSDLTERETYQYLDGLGRLIQTVKVKHNKSYSSYKDIFNTITYDNQGRVKKEYVQHFKNTTDGSYQPSTASWLKGNVYTYEASPLNRIKTTTPPGWYATTNEYGTNSANEVKDDLISGSYYPANELSKQIVIDFNGNKNISFLDKKGRTVLSRRSDATGNQALDTYTLYDPKDRVSKIIPPGATPASSDLIYEYLYDRRDNIISKKIPGQQSPMTMAYDARDLMISMQDANMAADNKIMNYSYDGYGRQTYSNYDIVGSASYFHQTETSYGTTGIETGKVIQESKRILGTNDYLQTNYSYDQFGRATNTTGNHPLNLPNLTSEDITTTFDFADNIIESNRIHSPLSSGNNITINESFHIDNAGKLENQYYSINNGPVSRTHFDYNVRDFNTAKYLGYTNNSNALQKIDYTYNHQGWLLKINNWCTGTPAKGTKELTKEATGLSLDIYYNKNEFTKDSDGFEFAIKTSAQVTNLSNQKSDKSLVRNYTISELREADPVFHSEELVAPDFRAFTDHISLNFKNQKIETENIVKVLADLRLSVLDKAKGADLEEHTSYLESTAQDLVEELIPFMVPDSIANPYPDVVDGIAGKGGSALSKDIFALKLFYNVGNTTLYADPQYNGNIAQMAWQVGCDNPQYYGFQYDFADRVKQSNYAAYNVPSGSYNSFTDYATTHSYDPRGNITGILRNGGLTATTHGSIDFLQMTYAGNQLTQVNELNLTDFKTHGFKTITSNGQGTYSYDVNGNLLSDEHKGISNIDYNYLNLPEFISFGGGNAMEWTYDASGNKLKKVVHSGSTMVTHDYISGIEYKDGNLEAIYHPEGRAVPDEIGGFEYEYHLKDHLGNVRVTFKDDPANTLGYIDETEIIDQTHYYPFGMKMEGAWNYATENKYLYNGKELNEEFGLDWSDYGARWYDASLGRWSTVDAMAEHPLQIDKSPYAYAWNNPIKLNDPDGNCPMCWGFLIGAGADLAIQVGANLASGKGAFENINKTDILLSGAAGAASGGLSVLTKANKVSKVGAAAGELAISTTESIAKQGASDEGFGNVNEVVSQTISDVAMDKIGGNATVVKKSDLKVKEKQADRAKRVAAGDPSSSGRAKKKIDSQRAVDRANNANDFSGGAAGNALQEVSNGAREALSGPDTGPRTKPNLQVRRDNTRIGN